MKKFKGFSKDEWEKIKSNLSSNDLLNKDETIIITEKIRKFCCLYREHLSKEAKKRFKNNASFQLENMLETLFLCFRKKNSYYLLNQITIDHAYLNAAFFCCDALSKFEFKKSEIYHNKLKSILNELNDSLNQNKDNQKNYCSKLFCDFEKYLNSENKGKQNLPIIIFSYDFNCQVSICLIELCLKLKIPIKGVVITKNFNLINNIKNYLKKIFKFLTKIFLISRKGGIIYSSPKEYFSIEKLRLILSPESNNIVEVISKHNIPFIKVKKLDKAIRFLKANKTDIGFFASGGIINQKIIDCFSIGIINAHKGILPAFKGINVAQAAIAEGRTELVGLTSHIIKKGIDTGPIINFYKVNPSKYKNINGLKNEMKSIMPFIIIFSYFKLINDSFNPTQQENLGRQYYEMHKMLISTISYAFNNDSRNYLQTDLSKDIDKILSILG